MGNPERIHISECIDDRAIADVPMEVWRLTDQGFSIERCHTGIRVDVGPADVEVIVGVVAAGAGILTAAITALLSYLAKRKSGKIVIIGKSGRKVEIPWGTSEEDIDLYIEKAKSLDATDIYIYRDSEEKRRDSAE